MEHSTSSLGSQLNDDYGSRNDARRLVPRQKVPDLQVQTLRGTVWRLSDETPERYTMVVFYRGYHCPVCSTYLRELDRLHAEFTKRGISVIAISSDTKERAEQSRDSWRLSHTMIGYGLNISSAREWGLYVSKSRGKSSSGIEEPAIFSEPGIFVVRPEAVLYWASITTMPFARPHFDEMVSAFDFVHQHDYPARGAD